MTLRSRGRTLPQGATFRDGTLAVREGDAVVAELRATHARGPAWLLRASDGSLETVHVVRAGTRWWVHARGRTHVLEMAAGDDVTGKQGAGSTGTLVAPMTGKVVDVHVAAGDRVAAGAALVVLSAMKMQLEVKAPFDGTVARVACRAGEQVEGGVVLAVVEPIEGSAT